MEIKRTNKKKVWYVKVYHTDLTLFEGQFATYKEISQALGLTYNQVFELSKNGRSKKKIPAFKFYPCIDIYRDAETDQSIKIKKKKEKMQKLCNKSN